MGALKSESANPLSVNLAEVDFRRLIGSCRFESAAMTQLDKLYARLLANPRQSIAFRDFERLLEAFGFTLARTTGSHRIYVHPLLQRPFPVQPDGKDAKRYQVREFLELIEEHSLYMQP